MGETEVSVGDMASRTKPASLRAAPPNPPVHSGGGAGAAGVKNFLGCTPTPVPEVTEHSRKDRARGCRRSPGIAYTDILTSGIYAGNGKTDLFQGFQLFKPT